MTHRWTFFRAGAVDQVSLQNGEDLLALPSLDEKLWVALAMPTTGVDVDPHTLALLDANKDGRIRVPEILAAIDEIKRVFKTPADVLKSAEDVKLSAIADDKVVAAAKRMLADLGKKDATAISVADSDAVTAAFATTLLNGDGIVTPESAGDDAATKAVVEDIVKLTGSVTDRSGKPGTDKALAEAFFADVDKQAEWLKAGAAARVLGDQTEAAADALRAVREKIEDFFTRCRLASFDPRAQAVLAGQEAELVALSSKTLASNDEAIAKLPIARIEPVARLQMSAAINPAWAAAMATFNDKTVKPILGAARDALTLGDMSALVEKLAPFETWRAAKPATKVDSLAADRINELAAPGVRAKVYDLIAADAALTAEYEQITSVARAVHFQRDFGRVLRNFVNFSDFYDSKKRDGVFQAGRLYIDGRLLHLCVPVSDAGKHGALAASSAACLLYCDITRDGVTKQIAAALTNGDADNVFPGRNGVFYDRDDKDWDATVTKIVSNPISLREAFWSPYKKLVKAIEDTVTKRASAADAAATAKMEDTGKSIGHTDAKAKEAGAAAAAAAAPVAPPPAGKKIDLGTVAAIGVAIGGIGTLVGALLGTMFGLGKWLPLGVLALLLMISGPAMLLAWLKLRRRNLGPILDANGWAINGRARINVSFGAAMTELAVIPKGSTRRLDDPFADKQRPWKLYIFLIVLLVLAGTWYVGRLDGYLPTSVKSVSVLGKHAPAYKPPAEKKEEKKEEKKAEPAAGSAAPAPAAPAAAAPAPAAPVAAAPAPAPTTPVAVPAPGVAAPIAPQATAAPRPRPARPPVVAPTPPPADLPPAPAATPPSP